MMAPECSRARGQIVKTIIIRSRSFELGRAMIDVGFQAPPQRSNSHEAGKTTNNSNSSTKNSCTHFLNKLRLELLLSTSESTVVDCG